MPEFVNPFSGMIAQRKMTTEELVRALRLDLAAEHEAPHTYMAHAGATDYPLAKAERSPVFLLTGIPQIKDRKKGCGTSCG